MKIKHTIIKNEDISKHLNKQEQEDLLRLFYKIQSGRVTEGKFGFNTYLVVNTDEAYAEEVMNILKDNGHWDHIPDPNQAEFELKEDVLINP